MDTTTDTLVIGGGQAGLSVSYHLRRLGIDHFVLDASERIGDAWRNRWDSLELFTPRRYDALDGMRMPGDPAGTPSKDEMADYLEAYAARFELPVLTGHRVTALSRDGEGFAAETAGGTFRAAQVIVAMSNYQRPRIPGFASELDAGIQQVHAAAYAHPGHLRPGRVLIVGAGNSGAELAKEIAADHEVIVAGPSTGEVPGSYAGFLNRHVVVHALNGVVFPHLLSVNTPMGRRMRPKVMSHGVPLIRVKSRDLERLGVVRAHRVTGVQGGLPLIDGAPVDVANVIWCSGYDPGLDWIQLPILDDRGEPRHERGVVPEVPGLYFVGLHFLTSMASAMVHGVGRDAARIAALVAASSRQPAAA
ncbi:flavin-containing monooxygenase [Leifsonia sp. 2MCAF36]|uniref:flavin-containing monooxygenase n=1 Tax=Leifsonia sp. 2MCAF36 TaxID=3232988 RepID=UPI003F9837E8